MEYLNYIDLNLKHAIIRTQELMAINSHSLNVTGVSRVQEIFKKYLTTIGYNVILVKSDKFGPHLIADNGVVGKGILIVCHADTAHAELSNFKEVRIEDDKVIGPGGYDMKAGAMTAIFALESLINTACFPEGLPIRILIISDEEVGMPDSFSLHEEEARKSRRALVMESGRPSNTIVLTRKGIAVFNIQAIGKCAHSGNEFWQGCNAISHLSEIVCELAKLSSKKDDLTLNVGVINGGQSPTIVPDNAMIKFDVRFSSLEKLNLITSKIDSLLGRPSEVEFKIKRELFLPPMQVLPETKSFAQSYLGSLESIGAYGMVNKEIIGGASSASLLTHFGLPTLDALGPNGEGAHTNTEWFSINSFSQKTKALAHWLSNNAQFI